MPSDTPERRSYGARGAELDLTGRSFLITGAGRGLGRAIALALADSGANVIAVSRTLRELEETAALHPAGRILPLAWDVSDVERCDDLVSKAISLGQSLDGVVHAAGIQVRRRAVDFTVADWRDVLSTNLEAPFFLSTALHRSHLRRGTAGTHVFIGSLTSSIGISGISAYAAGKAGLLGVVRSLAVEWADRGARVNCVAPGYVATSLTADLLADQKRSSWVHSRIPMGRLGEAREVASVVVFLVSDAAAYITGQLINVDGGWLAG